jgi:LAO/AO transport system kinase
MKATEIAAGVLKGDKRCIAKAITAIENEKPEAQELIARIFAHTGKAHIVGLTGTGGAGKSTLIEKIVREYRKKNKTVGIIAVDPTSPFTGGAFLGDRIRMQELSTDEGVYIRSMATRNYAGGISRATKDASKILDAAGKDIVIVETAGAGQSEVEIVRVAQTIIVLHAPGLGDEIQATKAGIMEIADIFVVNKADRENANKTAMDIQAMLQLGNKKSNWKTPVLKTIALTGEGVPELVQKIEEHRCFVEEDSGCNQSLLRAKAEADLLEAVRERAAKAMIAKLEEKGKLNDLLRDIMEKNVDPASAADKLVRKMINNAKT